jgi:DNA invertase Pin-like site-specific DNA recombinase
MMFQLLGMFAEFEREIIRDRVVAGIEKAKSKGTRLGRPSVAPITKKHVIQMNKIGWSQTRIAKKLYISQAKVSLILKEYRQRPVQIDADTDQGDIFGAVRAAS